MRNAKAKAEGRSKVKAGIQRTRIAPNEAHIVVSLQSSILIGQLSYHAPYTQCAANALKKSGSNVNCYDVFKRCISINKLGQRQPIYS